MSYKIEEIEGIGTAFAARLEEAGIHTTEDLLAYCETPTGREFDRKKLKNILTNCCTVHFLFVPL